MGRKCCFLHCHSNYDTSQAKNPVLKERNDQKHEVHEERGVHIPTFKFPDDPEKRRKWIRAVPYLTEEQYNTYKSAPVLCEKHWPTGYETTKSRNGKIRPLHPPSVWIKDGKEIPKSEIPTPSPKPRTTKRSSFEVRTSQEDQLNEFLEADKMSFESLTGGVSSHKFDVPVTTFIIDDVQWVQSNEFIHGIPKFALKIYKDLTFDSFRMGIQCRIPPLYKNNIFRLNRWSRIDVALHHLNQKEPTQHERVLQEHIDSMKPIRVGKKMYSPEILIRAFDYFATSRCLYGKLRQDYKLPSEKTMSNLTSKVNKLTDKSFIEEVFSNLKDDRQKQCVILVDEVYVKLALSYHAGTLFGKAKNNIDELANSVLGIMVKCLFGGPTFLFKMTPVKGMTADFLFQQVTDTIDLIKSAGGNVKVNVYDGNRTNQSVFKTFDTVEGKPWLTTDGMYLLYDYVHLLKNIRNNWLTEPSGELEYRHEGKTYTAKWEHLLKLHELEQRNAANDSGVRGMSKLNKVAVEPKPIERQNVSTCLRVFCDETSAALRVHPEMDAEEVEGTALFIDKVVKMWKILNVRSRNKNIRRNDPLVAEIESPDDPRLSYLLEMSQMFLDMKKTARGKRDKTLTHDTARSLHHTLNGIVELCRHQLSTTHKFVLLGEYSNDPIERSYGKLRQGTGGTYFLTVQQVMEKLNINKTKLLLKLNVNVSNLDVDPGHKCEHCEYRMDDDTMKIFDSMPDLEDKICRETKMSLVHMAGYVSRKDQELSEDEMLDVTTFYFQKYGDYTQKLDRGGLNIPSDKICQWAFFSYILFNSVKDNVCRKSLSNLFMLISTTYELGMERRHATILTNIFLKNHCTQSTPKSSKEYKQKLQKFTN